MPTLVQSIAGGSVTTSGSTPITATTSAAGFASPTTAGNLLVLVAWATYTQNTNTNSAPGFSLPVTAGFTWSASASTTWTEATSPMPAGRVAIYYIANAASMSPATTTTIAATDSNSGFSVSTFSVEFALYEFSGIATTLPVETSATGRNVSGTPSTPATSNLTIANTDLVIAAVHAISGSYTAGSGFTLGVPASVATVGAGEYELNAAPGTITPAFVGSSGYWAAASVAFKPGSGAPTQGNIVTTKVTHPMGSAQVFTFTPSWGAPFTLTDGTQHDSGLLAPGTYSIVETPVTNWSTSFSQNPSTIVVTAGNTTTVTFTNFFMPAPNKFITGMWQDPFGVPIAYGILSLKLNQDAVVISTTQIAPRNIAITLDTTGSIPNNTAIWTNDQLSPNGTFYALTISDSGGGIVYGPQYFSIAGASPINLNNLVPVSGGSTGGGGGTVSLSFQDSVQTISTTQAVGFSAAINTLILATAGVGGITLTLPSAVGVSGQTMRIVMVDTGAGGVSIVTTGGQTISGRANYVLSNQWQYAQLESNNSNWIIVSAN